ncbi:GNAT family N-acetyltransferase [Brevundimonas sp. SORGH_AS_0993]|uniref:GNAT family N-acetyltransferase n=1 Tax=Brevundimonas sp. SORGH_AS_0993 TaxID=3041794 RepID=UPI00278761DE|nr:GNAT family N-acetyltransferase [Brevundimonas sp. SORGH_AS_0993]MDQ1155474.1 putative GNAT family acetyltransferase [Brevundimonas sp. SORGH_AS_0993]
MGDLRDETADQRFLQTFEGQTGAGRVWADYAVRDGVHFILHVEAEPSLRGTGAAGRFMRALADHARQDGLKLVPRCSYAVVWFRRHSEYDDVLA